VIDNAIACVAATAAAAAAVANCKFERLIVKGIRKFIFMGGREGNSGSRGTLNLEQLVRARYINFDGF